MKTKPEQPSGWFTVTFNGGAASRVCGTAARSFMLGTADVLVAVEAEDGGAALGTGEQADTNTMAVTATGPPRTVRRSICMVKG